MPSHRGIVRLTAFTAILGWLAFTATDFFLAFGAKNQLNVGIPVQLSVLFLNIYIISLFIHYKYRIEHSENVSFVDMLWRVFVTGLIATIVSVFIRFFLSLIAGSKYGQYELLLNFLYHINIGLILAFIISTFLVWKKLILYQKTKNLLKIWQVFEYGLLASIVLYFFPYRMGSIPFNVVMVFLIIMSLVVSVNLKWVAYLNFKQKWKSILLILLVVLYLAYFMIYLWRASDQGMMITDLMENVFVMALCAFILIYSLISLLVILFNLPTTSVFEQKLEEVVNFQKLSQSNQTGDNEEQVFDILLESSVSTTFANAAWFEVNNNNGKSVILKKDISDLQIEHIRQLVNNQKLKRNLIPTFKSKHQDGDYTVIDRIKDPQFKSALIYPLIVQSQKIGSMVLLKEVTGGFNKDVVNIIKTFGNQAGVSIENFRLLRSALENERYQEEIKIAKRVQESLLPDNLESNGTMDIVAFSTAADEVGGDYYDAYRVNEHKMVVIIGDVSGKGTSAAFNMSQMKGVFHSLVPLNLSAKDFLIRANDALSRCLERTSFITLSYFIIDTKNQQIEFCRAGHCPSLFYSQQKGKTCFLENKGMGLGIIRNQEYSQYIEVNQLSYGAMTY